MTANASTIKLSFDEVSFLLKVAEFGLKAAVAEDRTKAGLFAKPFAGKGPKAEYAPLLATLQSGVTASKAYGSCVISLTPPEKATLSRDFLKYRQANPVPPEHQKALEKVNKA